MRTLMLATLLLTSCGGTAQDPPQSSTGSDVGNFQLIGWCDQKAVGELSEPIASSVTAQRCTAACSPILAAILDGGTDPLPLPLYCSMAWPF